MGSSVSGGNANQRVEEPFTMRHRIAAAIAVLGILGTVVAGLTPPTYADCSPDAVGNSCVGQHEQEIGPVTDMGGGGN